MSGARRTEKLAAHRDSQPPRPVDSRVRDTRSERAGEAARRPRAARDPPGRRRAEEQGAALGDRQRLGPPHPWRRQVLPDRRHAGAEARDRPLHRGALRPRGRAGERDRLLGGQAVDLQRAARDRRPAGRGRDPRAVLGQLPGDGADGARPARDRDAGGRRLRAPARRGGVGARPVHEGRDREQPQQPDGRGLPAGADRGPRRALRGARRAPADGRHLSPARLRRRPRPRRPTRSPTATSTSRP